MITERDIRAINSAYQQWEIRKGLKTETKLTGMAKKYAERRKRAAEKQGGKGGANER